jgi:hypothetical protein
MRYYDNQESDAMLHVDGDSVSFEEAVKKLDYNEMRESGIESFRALVHLAQCGIDCCGHHWKFE